MNKAKVLTAMVACYLLSSCGGGGGGGGDENPQNVIPTTTNPETSPTASGGPTNGPVAVNPGTDIIPAFLGNRPSVERIYSESQIAAIESIGLQLNLGSNPPNVEGTFSFEPQLLQASTVPNEANEIGDTFDGLEFTFSNQDNEDLTLDFSASETSTNVVATSSFISGSGNAFTVYLVAEVTLDGHTFESTETYSGVVSDGGILNLQRALFVIDDRGDPNDAIIANDSGRLFIDQDGFSEQLGLPEPIADDPETFFVAENSVDALLGAVTFEEISFVAPDNSFTVMFTEIIATPAGNSSVEAELPSGTIACTILSSEDGVFFCPLLSDDGQSITSYLFSLTENGEGIGVFDVCDGLEACDLESIFVRLDDDPDGLVFVTVDRSVNSLNSALEVRSVYKDL